MEWMFNDTPAQRQIDYWVSRDSNTNRIEKEYDVSVFTNTQKCGSASQAPTDLECDLSSLLQFVVSQLVKQQLTLRTNVDPQS